jgi:hypothetical protein
MPYWKSSGTNSRSLNNFSLATNQSNGGSAARDEFYELELGIVLDIVLDDKHPIFSSGNKQHVKLDIDRWPEDLEDKKALKDDKDFTWIGRALVRPIISEKLTDKDQLIWAFPLESNISEFPLLNETVILVKHLDKLFYTRKVNLRNTPNNNLDFSIEEVTGNDSNKQLFGDSAMKGPVSNTKFKGGTHYQGVAGSYFKANSKIRALKRYEGDMSIESRFGQSIHLSAYDSNRGNDAGAHKDYKDGGNPMILIRNRQRPLVKQGSKLIPHKKLPPILGTEQEKNVGGFLEEDINHDGSSIHITSGQTISKWVTTCYKKMYGEGEEQGGFQGSTGFKLPTLNGDQIVINSDRLVLSSRFGETFHYSKKRYGIVTDNEYTVDAHQQIVLTTNTKTVINSPAIYLGEVDNTEEPVLLGQTTVNWLFELCNWLLEHTHHHIHSHQDAGKESPSTTQVPVQVQKLIKLRDRLKDLMSRRVFVVGGGKAPGKDGGEITDGTAPIKVNVGNGSGVPGGWKGANYRG